MSRKRVKPEDFDFAIREIIQECADETAESAKEATISTGKAAVQLVRANVEKAGIRGTKYKNSFKATTTTDTPFTTTVTIHSPKHYRLTHLLEHGHRIVVRKKVRPGRARAFAHLAPAEQEAGDLLEKKVRIAVKG